MIKDYVKLLRIKHYIKNLLVFFPMIFAGEMFDPEKIVRALLGFACFSLLSSAIYILNDYKDIENDRRHPVKQYRPLASGRIKLGSALIIMMCCLLMVGGISALLGSWKAFFCLVLYLVLNIAYTMGLKNKAIIDIVILASGFVIRTLYGGYITDIEISKWLYLVVTTGSLYMGLGKRRNELKRHTGTREVLKDYNDSFLEKNMYVCVALADVFYALWTIEMANSSVSWTVPAFIVILMRYSLDIEGDSDGDPVEVILHDKILIGMLVAYAAWLFLLLYIFS